MASGFYFRCSDDDLARWRRRAEELGVSLSELIRISLDGRWEPVAEDPSESHEA